MDDQTAILTAITDYREAFNTGDTERLLSVFAPFFADYSHGVPSFWAEDAFTALRQRMNKLFAEYTAEMRIATVDVVVSGDIAYDFGWHTLILSPKTGGDPITTRQRYVALWGRQPDGNWKITVYIENADVPPAMPHEDFSVPYLSAIGR